MPEYIEREKAYELARTSELYSDFHRSMADLTSLKELLEDTPTADVVEVRHGEWIAVSSSDMSIGKAFKCNKCQKMRYGVRLPPYCQECGAKMDGKGVDYA